MKISNLLILTILLTTTFMACNRSSNYDNSAHGQLLSEQKRVKAEHKDIRKLVKGVKENTAELIKDFRKTSSSDSESLSKLMADESLVIEMEGLLAGHEAIFNQNTSLFKKHEDSPLSAKEIEAQHRNIANNLSNIKGDLINVKTRTQLINNSQVALGDSAKAN